MQIRPIVYLVLATLVLCYALWGIGRVLLSVNQPMGGFVWYYDEAVSGGWIINWDTGLEWPAIRAGLELGDRILAIDGRPPEAFGDVYRTKPLGAGVTYRVLRKGQELVVRDVPIVRFSWGMFVQSQLVLFAIGVIYWLMGMFVHRATPESDYSYAFSFFALATSLLTLTHAATVSIRDPLRPQFMLFFTWKPIFGAAIISSLYFATTFPVNAPELPPPLSKEKVQRAAWIIGLSVFVAYVVTGLLPKHLLHWEALVYQINLGAFVLSLITCAAIFGYTLWKSSSFVARQQARVMLLGWGLATFPIFWMLIKLLFPHFSLASWNYIAFFELALPLSMVYAILRYRMFSVRPYVLRALSYVLPLASFVFVYLTLFIIVQDWVWFDKVQQTLTTLTFQTFDVRTTLCTLLAVFFAFRMYNSFRLWSEEEWPQATPRFSAMLAHLCDRMQAKHACLILQEGQAFRVRATHNMPLPAQTLDRQAVLEDEADIALKIPLRSGDNVLLGALALGPKEGDQPYIEADRRFLTGTVADLLVANLRHLQQLEAFSEAITTSKAQAAQVAEEKRSLQQALIQTLTVKPETITVKQLKEALKTLRRTRPSNLKELGNVELANTKAVYAKLQAEGVMKPTLHQKGQALRSILLRGIESFKPKGDPDPLDETWQPYLVLYKTFVRDQGWQTICDDLSITKSPYYRKRKAAMEMLAVQLQQQDFADN